ncbi:unnamed protein product, partial [Sphagnum jensenii]
ARSPVQGPLKSYGDDGCLSDGSGSGSGQSGVGNVINPGEYVGQPAPALGSDQILPAGNGEEGGTKLSELDMQQVQQQQQWQQHNLVDRWNQASSDECGDVSDVNEDGNHHHHQGCEAPLKPPQHSSSMRNTRRLCAVMLDTVGPELCVVNSEEVEIELVEGAVVVLTGDQTIKASNKVLSVNSDALKCNRAGKPAIVTRVVDSMVDNPRPTRAEATDVANAVLDGADGILLGAETLRGLYPVETITTIYNICGEAEKVFNQAVYFKRAIKGTPEPMQALESIASSAARQCLVVRGLFPMLADPRHSTDNTTNESILKVALDHGKAAGIVKSHDRVVVFQKLGDSSVVKIIEID